MEKGGCVKEIGNGEQARIAKMLVVNRHLKEKTQTQCGRVLGVTFQQVQKQETCLNRITADQLFTLAKGHGYDMQMIYKGDPYQVLEQVKNKFIPKIRKTFQKIDENVWKQRNYKVKKL